VLDAHPDLACPPETRLPGVLTQLATAWSATHALSWPGGKASRAPILEAAAAGVRHTVDQMLGPYLAGRGKKRYCDKNLGTEQHAEVLLGVFPDAKFLCLYRHPMDMIASGVEACPWGLVNYGFEPYAARAPGNSVHALARYWADHTAAILAVQEKYPGSCHRIRYEDLVAEPEAVASDVFGFLGVPAVAGISSLAFSRERERSGPGDFKIWNTSEIGSDSVGRGWSVPANLIPAPLLATVNEIADRLGYVRVDEKWGAAARPGDLRVAANGQVGPQPSRPAGPAPPGAIILGERVRAGLGRLDARFARDWQPYRDGSFLITALAPGSRDDDAWWFIDLNAGTAVTGRGACQHNELWSVTGPATAWEAVIRDGTNLGLAFRRHGMRYRDKGDGGAGSVLADNRVAMLSDLLAVTSWKPDPPTAPAGPPPGAPSSAQMADLDMPLWSTSAGRLADSLRAVARTGGGHGGPAGQPAEPPPRAVRITLATQRMPPPKLESPRSAVGGDERRQQPAAAPASRVRTGSARDRLRAVKAREARRRRLTRAAAVGSCVIAVVAVGIWINGLARHGQPAPVQAHTGYQGPYAPVTLNADNSVTMSQPGVSGPVLDVYEDFECPACGAFERIDGGLIQRLAFQGKVKVVYHPFTSFSTQPQQASSVRAWAAVRCAPASVWVRYHNALYAAPSAGAATGRFPVSLLVRLGKQVGISNADFIRCVRSQTYADLDAPVSDEIMNSGLNSLPVLKLNGRIIAAGRTPDGLRRLILSGSGGGPTVTARVWS
jgi:protein-disulfide isomerase